MARINGQCLCGDVRFSAPEAHHIDVCHCDMCRRWTGSAFIGVDYRVDGIELTKSKGLKLFNSSDWAKRGFCANCGSSLFYRLNDNNSFWAVSAGSLEVPKGLALEKEIFIDEKPDYYDFSGNQKKLTGAEFFASLKD